MIAAIITVRDKSTRLDNKWFADINGKPMLQHIVDVVKPLVDDVIVATSIDSPKISDYCAKNFIRVCGVENEDDVLSRIRTVIEVCKLGMGELRNQFALVPSGNTILRLWGDNPFLNLNLIKYGLECKDRESFDYVFTESVPKGWNFAMFDARKFLQLCDEMSSIEKYHWNHVEENSCWVSHGFNVKPISMGGSSNLYTVDTLDDLEKAREICKLMV